ncbi:unnamed protein product [Rangifer tarandus platyrhynchus]|uniref:Uncharacterized protein n=1 Tax=Rangifer tarandus platyrhynchus TaxID=3082113 RepID=A0AC59ZTD9_RANTA
MSGPPYWENSSLLDRISDFGGCWSCFCSLQTPEHPHCGLSQPSLMAARWSVFTAARPLLLWNAKGCPGSTSSVIHGLPRTFCWQSWIIQQSLGQGRIGKLEWDCHDWLK